MNDSLFLLFRVGNLRSKSHLVESHVTVQMVTKEIASGSDAVNFRQRNIKVKDSKMLSCLDFQYVQKLNSVVLSFRYRHILVTKMNKTVVRWVFQTPSATKSTRKAHSIPSPLKASLAQTSSWWFTSRASSSRPEAPFKPGRRICHEKYSGVAYSKIW